MMDWLVMPSTDVLWRNALMAAPLALLVAVLCRWIPIRPATRHGLWLTVLLSLILPPMLPGMMPTGSAGNGRLLQGPVAMEPARVEPGSLARLARTPDSTARSWTSSSPDGSDLQEQGRPSTPIRTKRSRTGGESIKGDGSPSVKNHHVSNQADVVKAGKKERRAPATTSASPPMLVARESGDVRSEPTQSSPLVGMEPESPGAGTVSAWLAGLWAIQAALFTLPPIPAVAWYGGSLLILVLGVFRVWRLRRVIVAARPAPPAVLRMVNDVSESLGLRRVPETLLTAHRVSPFIWCGRRLRLVLPRRLWAELEPESRRAVLLHELAHVRRKDHWVCRTQLLVGCLYWWHPLVWWIRSRLDNEADACCDAWVTWLFPRGRRAYAEALVKTKQFLSDDHLPMPAVGIGVLTGRAGNFARRLTMVMTQRNKPHASLAGIGLACLLVAGGWLASPARSCEPTAATPKASAGCGTKGCKDCVRCKAAKECELAAQHAHAKAAAAPIPRLTPRPGQPAPALAPVPCLPPVAVIPGVWADHESTFNKHMKAKKGKATGYWTTIPPEGVYAYGPTPPAPPAPPSPPSAPRARRHGPGGPNPELEERLAQLELQLARLGEQLAQLGGSFDGQAAAERINARVHRDMARAEVRRAKELKRELKQSGQDKIVVRSYKVSGGKLEALTQLMAREDVPIKVRPTDGAIEVHASEAQHRVFSRFVDLIDPGKDRESSAFESPEEHGFAVVWNGDDDDDADDHDADDDDDDDEDEEDEEDADDDDDDDSDDDDDEEGAAVVPSNFGELAERFASGLAERVPELLERFNLTSATSNQADYDPAIAPMIAQASMIEMGKMDSALALAHSLEAQAALYESQARSIEDQARAQEEYVRAAESHTEAMEQSADRIQESAESAPEVMKNDALAEFGRLRIQALQNRLQYETIQRRAEKLFEGAERLQASAEALREAARTLHDRMANMPHYETAK